VIVIRNVPSLVCDQCGSDWIEDDISEKLELMVNSARKNTQLWKWLIGMINGILLHNL